MPSRQQQDDDCDTLHDAVRLATAARAGQRGRILPLPLLRPPLPRRLRALAPGMPPEGQVGEFREARFQRHERAESSDTRLGLGHRAAVGMELPGAVVGIVADVVDPFLTDDAAAPEDGRVGGVLEGPLHVTASPAEGRTEQRTPAEADTSRSIWSANNPACYPASMWLGRLGPAEVIGWIAVTAALLFFAWRRLCEPVGGPVRRSLGIMALAAPFACLLASILCFAGNSHPLVQYNDGASLGGWSAWVRLWPLLLLLSLVGGLLAFGLAAKEDRMPKRVTAWLLLTLLNGIAFVGVFSNWPSA